MRPPRHRTCVAKGHDGVAEEVASGVGHGRRLHLSKKKADTANMVAMAARAYPVQFLLARVSCTLIGISVVGGSGVSTVSVSY